jgi:hypothetical protein
MANRKKPRKVKKATPKALTVHFHHVSFTQEQFCRLSIEQRYCVLLLGHIQHEISWLQRTVYIASRSGRHESELERAGKVMQGGLLTRLLLGKLNEFRSTVESTPIIRTFLEEWFNPEDVPSGRNRVADLLNAFESDPWLQRARNQHFLHYPTLGNVRATLEDPNFAWSFDMYAAHSTMNSIYATSDVLANMAWYRLVNQDAPIEGLDRAYDSMASLSGEVIKILEMCIGEFVDRNLGPILEGQKISLTVQSRIDDVRLPFFVALNDGGEIKIPAQ